MTESGLPLSRVVSRLAAGGLAPEVRGPAEVIIHGVSQDSRSVQEGDLFLAWRGVEHDAHHFVHGAVARGAVAVVVERTLPELAATQVVVPDGRLAGALAADEVFGSPWSDLLVYAVTGTNGKTTTALLARHLLGRRRPTAAIGTLGVVQPNGTVRPGTEGLTTPGPVETAAWTRSLAHAGARALGLEASSHALAQRRLDGLRFDVVAFTNLTQDHLDYHEDLTEYRDSKARLVELALPDGTVVVNSDDPAWMDLDVGSRRRISYGVESRADMTATGLDLHPAGTRFELGYGDRVAHVALPLLGRFNVENALAAAGIAAAAGHDLEDVVAGLAAAPPVRGRLEVVVGEPFSVIIDFAHTPDALERLLDALRPLTRGRLIALFGAAGDRDRAKRPLMGRAVDRRADLAVVTSDNPRTEPPEEIIDDVAEGMTGGSYERIADRAAAIHRALDVADAGDVVVLAGKGHETYQVIGHDKVPFDEREIVLEYLGRWAA